MALDSGHVLRGKHAHALPNVGSFSLSPPSLCFCSLVSTSSPADCTKGKLITANNNKTQPPAQPQNLPLVSGRSPSPPFRELPLAHVCT